MPARKTCIRVPTNVVGDTFQRSKVWQFMQSLMPVMGV